MTTPTRSVSPLRGVPILPRGKAETTGFTPAKSGRLSIKTSIDSAGLVVASFAGFPEVGDREIHSVYLALCCKLSTYRLYGDKVFIPYNPGVNRYTFGKLSLYQTFGRYLPPRIRKDFSNLPKILWDKLEGAWLANMLTILLNEEIDLTVVDWSLIESIRSYKRWFVIFSLKNAYVGIRRKKKVPFPFGKRRYRVIVTRQMNLPGFRKLLSGLKTFSAWLQFSALCSDLNSRPKELPWFPGWDSNLKLPKLPWYPKTGQYSKFRNLIDPFDKDLSTIRLILQMKSFGRALPCPTTETCRDALKECVNVLTVSKDLPDQVLDTFRIFSGKLADHLGVGEAPRATHVSVSTSACCGSTTSEGGKANALRSTLDLNSNPNDWFFYNEGIVETPQDNLFDCWGRNCLTTSVLLSHPKLDVTNMIWSCFYRNSTDIGVIRQRGPIKPMDVTIGSRNRPHVYIRHNEAVYPRPRRDLLATLGWRHAELFNGELGEISLLLSSGESLSYGKFDRKPDLFLVNSKTRLRLPLWKSTDPVTFIPVTPPECELLVLAEPGAKCRPLTKNRTWLTLIFQSMRFQIEPIVARDGRARIGLRHTNKMWDFLKYLRKSKFGPGAIAQSTDYSAATDHLDLKLIFSIWQPFVARLPKTHPFRVYSKLIWSNRKLIVPKYITNDDITHRCGSFMGEPLSFITLTLYNLLLEEITNHYWLSKEIPWSPPRIITLGKSPCAICGDDLAAIRYSMDHVELFNKLVRESGSKLSPGKDGKSYRVLIFTEDHLLIDENVDFIYVDVIKARLLTRVVRQHSDNRSSILGKGRMLSNQLDYLENTGYSARVMQIYSYIRNLEYKDYFTICKYPWFLPPILGGAGIPVDKIPEWGQPYLKVISDWILTSDWLTLLKLKGLNSPDSKGITVDETVLRLLTQQLKNFKIFEKVENFNPTAPSRSSLFSVFSDKAVFKYLEDKGADMPPDPYEGRTSRDLVSDVARRYGFLPFSEYISQIERGILFNEFIMTPRCRSQRTLSDWERSSKKFWRRKNLPFIESDKYMSIKDMQRLESKLKSKFFGFVASRRGPDDPIRYLPTMAISARRGRLLKISDEPCLGSGEYVLDRQLDESSVPNQPAYRESQTLRLG